MATKRSARPVTLLATLAAAGWAAAGCVDPRCFDDGDCTGGTICDPAGRCVPACTVDEDCGPGFRCEEQHCVPAGQGITCPGDMVAVADTFCVDRFEASRPDATGSSAGTDSSVARSVAGVIPWMIESNAAAEAACLAAGKRLCTSDEWTLACKGPDGTVYAYGDLYEPATCNGIDTFGRTSFHLMPTGAFPGCTNEWGAFDLNGNVWEHISGGSDRTVRGGAFNCGDSATYQRCDYIPGSWTPSARGFRCCLSESQAPDDGGVPDAGVDALPHDGGCIEEDAGVDAPSADAPADTPAVDAPADAPAADASLIDGPVCDAAPCPDDMVPVGSFCIDRWEASRADATASSAGTSTIATSRPGVLPWFSTTTTLAEARAGCASAGKRLCTPDEWFTTCTGPSGTVYPYGDDYDALLCNGIDTYCQCGSAACASLLECPYPHCYHLASPEGGGPCGSTFHIMPTGSFPACTNAHGTFDASGNVWELVETTDGLQHWRGGAYNCLDSVTNHRCDYDATWSPAAKGFRCCRDQG